MISRPLLKQSIKANGLAWLLVTLLTAFMLGTLVFVLGSIQANEIRDSLKDTIIESELEARFKQGAIEGYCDTLKTVEEVHEQAEQIYDLTSGAIDAYDKLKSPENPNPKPFVINLIVAQAPEEEKERVRAAADYILTEYESKNPDAEGLHDFKCEVVIDLLLANMGEEMSGETRAAVVAISREILDIYAVNQKLEQEDLQKIARLFIEEVFYGNLLKGETEEQKELLSGLGFATMEEMLEYYGFTEFKVKTVIQSGLLQYISYVNNNISHEEALKEVSGSLVTEMPEKVAKSLEELGNMNINHLVIGSIFYKIAGLLLPIVYTIMTANNLIAGQIDSGSMAYVLSTPTKRRKVALTQLVFLVGSLIVMFLIIGSVGMLASALTDEGIQISYGDMIEMTLGAMTVMFAIGGICYLASAWFNRSKHAMGVGGGISMFFLVSTILGLFGSESVPEAMRIEAMDFFNYTSIISLFDVKAILEGGSFTLGLVILLLIGISTYTLGIFIFDKKDLPL